MRTSRTGWPSSFALLRVGFGVSIVLWGAAAHVVGTLGTPGAARLIQVAWFGVVPLTVIAAVATFFVRSPVLLQALGGALNIVAGGGVLYVSHDLPDVFDRLAASGIILAGVFAFMRLRFVTACISFGIVVLAFTICVARLGVAVPLRMVSLFVVHGAFLLLAMNGRLGERATRDAFFERSRSESLLLHVLPAPIAARLRESRRTVADALADVTVLFSDIVGFTPLSATMPPATLVQLLDELFSVFDDIAERNGVEKIKTMGDAYMAVAGAPVPRPDHAEAAATMAFEMLEAVDALAASKGLSISLRVGIHTGPVVAGVIGKKKLAYDLWGDTVNVASRMESHGQPGAIQVSESTWHQIQTIFEGIPRGAIDVKGKGKMPVWILTGRRA